MANPTQLSEEGLEAIRDSEGLRLFAYPDPGSPLARATRGLSWGFAPGDEILWGLSDAIASLSGKPWTIGYGTTVYPNGQRVQPGDKCTKSEAEVWLARSVDAEYGRAVVESISVPINQPMFDALVSLAYNIGAPRFRESTLVRLLNEGDYIGAGAEFDRWVNAQGVRSVALIKRRDREQAWFNEGIRTALAGDQEALARFDGLIGGEGTA